MNHKFLLIDKIIKTVLTAIKVITAVLCRHNKVRPIGLGYRSVSLIHLRQPYLRSILLTLGSLMAHGYLGNCSEHMEATLCMGVHLERYGFILSWTPFSWPPPRTKRVPELYSKKIVKES